MSPGVADIRSSINSTNDTKSTQSALFPNPNPSFNETPNFSSFVPSFSDSMSFSTSNISTTSDGALNNSFHSVSESRGSLDKSKVFSNSSSRSRPRLVKVRKQSVFQHARSKTVKENTNRATDAGDTKNQFSSGEFGKFSHVFSESSNSNDNNSFNFVFGDTKSNMVPISKLFDHGSGGISKDNGSKESAGKVGNFNLEGLKKFSNMVSDYDTNIANTASSFTFDVKEPTIKVDTYHAERKEAEKGTKSEFQKHDHVDFVFGGADKSSLLNSKMEKKEPNNRFVFGAAQNDLQSSSNSKQVETNGSVGKSFSFDNEKLSSTLLGGKFENVGSVFGTDKSDSASTAEAKIDESKEKADNFSFIPIGKKNVDGETEHHYSKVDGVFIFGSGSKGSLNSHLGNDVKNPNIEKAENCNDNLKGEGNSTDSSSKSMFNFVFGSRSHLGEMFNCPPSKLSDEMKKMNIHDYGNPDGDNVSKISNFSSFANNSDKFVCGSENKASLSFTGTSTSTSCQFQGEDASDAQNSQVVKNPVVVNDITGERKVAGLGNSNNNSGSFGDSVENTIPDTSRNWETRSETGLFSGQKIPFYCTSGTRGKENKGIKPTENGMDGKRNVVDQASISNGVNEYFCPSSSTGFGYQSFDSSCEAPTGDKAEKKDKEFTFPSTPVHLRPTFTGFSPPKNMPANLFSGDRALRKDTSTNTPVQLGPSFTGFSTPTFNMPDNLFSGLCTKLNFSTSKKQAGARRLKKTRGKSRQHIVSKESNSQQNEASFDCSSPMDFSPYEEASCAPSAPHSTIASEGASEGLAAARERSHAKGDNNWVEENENCLKDQCGAEPQINPKTERNNNNVPAGTSAEARDFQSNTEREEDNSNSQYYFTSSQIHGDQRFSFAASSAQHNTSASTRKRIKKYRMKVGCASDSTGKSWNTEFESSSVKYFDPSKSSVLSNEFQGQRGDTLNTHRGEHTPNAGEKQKKEHLSEAATVEACEKWRIRGNQAYRKGSLSKAENFYTKCIDSITHMKTPECCIEPLLLCYSNRAAARMCLGKIREALRDCTSAASLDSDFRKVQMRAANCHLVLGEVEDAMQYFNKCMESGVDVCLDRRIMIEAADGLQKSQKVTECINQAAELLQQRTYDAANDALRIIMEALSISCHSEKLLEMKGEALCMLRKYEEVVLLCEQTLGFAEKNFASIDNANRQPDTGGSSGGNSDIKLWRWRLMSKSYFHMGRLEASLDLSRHHEQLRSTNDKYRSKENDSLVTLAATVHELLELKNAGNKAFQSGKHAEAVEQYTTAISSSVQSRPFAAVCFCNRAAAHQAMGKISDAIADCSLAIALDESYGKALSRRATLHEMIRDYEQAANDLQRFINLQKQSKEINHEATDTPMGSGGKRDSLKEACSRLCSVERKAKKGTPLDFYLLLGVKVSDTSSDIKKAYHRAALKHHPDKAGQFLVRTETGDEGPLRKEIVDKIHVEADRLFKMIGEAYAVLSDISKRAKYDREEDIRKESEHDKYNSSGRESNVYSSPFGSRNNGGVYGGESWKTYGKTRYRW